MTKTFLDIIPSDVLRFIYEEFLDGKYTNGTWTAQISSARKIPLLHLPIPRYSNASESIYRIQFWLVSVILKGSNKNNTNFILCKKNYENVHTPDVKTYVKY